MAIQEDLLDKAREGVSNYEHHLRLIQDKSILDHKSLETLAPDLVQNPGLLKLVREYCKLATKSRLSCADIERMAQISELAEYDEQLDHWVTNIDEHVEPMIVALLQERLSLEDFIYEVKNTPSQKMTFKRFKELAQKVDLSDRFVNNHIHFQNREYSRQTVCHTSFGDIFIISWKPEQASSTHYHENDFSVIYVYKGTLTHELYEKEKEVVFHEGREGWRDKYILKDKQQAEENDWVCVSPKQSHRLVNKSEKNLVTVHFRLFGQSIWNEDDRPSNDEYASNNLIENRDKLSYCDTQ